MCVFNNHLIHCIGFQIIHSFIRFRSLEYILTDLHLDLFDSVQCSMFYVQCSMCLMCLFMYFVCIYEWGFLFKKLHKFIRVMFWSNRILFRMNQILGVWFHSFIWTARPNINFILQYSHRSCLSGKLFISFGVQLFMTWAERINSIF
jgi:hypothetical protein